MMPKQAEIEIPLLRVIAELGNGQGRPRDIYPLLEKLFPGLTKQDLEERLEFWHPKVDQSGSMGATSTCHEGRAGEPAVWDLGYH